MAPHTPQRSEAPGRAGALLDPARHGPPHPPNARKRPGPAVALLDSGTRSPPLSSHGPAAARSSRATAVGPPALTRPSSASPTTKKSPTETIAARWLPDSSHDTPPNTRGPTIAPGLPTSE